MSRIFVFSNSPDMIYTLRHPLECDGHDVYANLVIRPGDTSPRLVTNVVDVVGLLVQLRPFPDVVIAEVEDVDGGWLGGLIYDMEIGQNCSLILLGTEETEKIKQLKKLYGAHFWRRPLNVLKLIDFVETFFAVSC